MHGAGRAGLLTRALDQKTMPKKAELAIDKSKADIGLAQLCVPAAPAIVGPPCLFGVAKIGLSLR